MQNQKGSKTVLEPKTNIEILVDRYISWLRDKTKLRTVGDWIEITTPWLDRHNDHLQIYVKHTQKGFLLTDEGYILENLAMSGCNLEGLRRQPIFTSTLKGFGVHVNGKALEVKASEEDFPLCMHNLVRAMCAVNDLSHLGFPDSIDV